MTSPSLSEELEQITFIYIYIPPLKPYLLYCNEAETTRYIIDIALNLDINVGENINLKYENYMQLSSELEILYSNFIVPLSYMCYRTCTIHFAKKIEEICIKNSNKANRTSTTRSIRSHGGWL